MSLSATTVPPEISIRHPAESDESPPPIPAPQYEPKNSVHVPPIAVTLPPVIEMSPHVPL